MSNTDSFSFLRGYSFSFEDNGNTIKAWFSSLTGKEKVFVNNQLVSSQRNLSKNSSNHFSIKDDNYSTSIIVKSIFTGPITCTLIKNNTPFKRKKLIFKNIEHVNKHSYALRLIAYVTLGLLLGFLLKPISSYLQLPETVIFTSAFLVIFIAIYFNYRFNKKSFHKPSFIEEDITLAEQDN